MFTLNQLKKANDFDDFAKLLGYKPEGLRYVLYRIKKNQKYRTFTVPKKSGGERIINAPHPYLSLLQKRLAQMLYECVEEYKKENPRFWFASHGFQKKRTIVSNAQAHKNKRFVFNLDLEDFFGTINFWRVRGFFMKDRMFELNEDVATVIAQIVCHENKLPQGSPCSPIISNLIGNILDSRLLALARDTQCTYTRYADDLTFSTNKKLFPSKIAMEMENGGWDVGKKLHKTIKDTRFTINPSKTRMSLRQSRQTVTGLVVNKKVNIKKEYYLNARAMCNSLFQTGFYHRPYDSIDEKTDNLNHLEGTLAHIYFVKRRRDRKDKINRELEKTGGFILPLGVKKLYRKFLFYKYFFAPPMPLIITKNAADIVYLKSAIRAFSTQFPSLANSVPSDSENNKLDWNIRFLKPSSTIREVLYLVNGTGGQAHLINFYKKDLEKYNHSPKIKKPVIILCDNNDGAEKIFEAAGTKANIGITTGTTKPFYKIFENLYLVKIPEGGIMNRENIEELFSKNLLNTKISGKSFNYKNKFDKSINYGRSVFAEKVLSKATDPDDFEGFIPLLERIQGVIAHHKAKK